MTQRLFQRTRLSLLLAGPGTGVFGSALAGVLALAMGAPAAFAAEPNFPITTQQRATAKKVAEAGVPLSELAPNAPDSHTVKKGDTLWGISGLFLKSPWRWPELWGMNMDQIHNPHLIYPGQILVLEKSGGRARLRVGQALGPDGTVRLSPRVRIDALSDAISAVPLHLIQPFLNEAVVLNSADELANSPRIVASQEGRVVLSRGDTAYVRGNGGGLREWRIFRTPKPLKDPSTGEILGYEAAFVGTAELTATGDAQSVPDSYTITGIRQEAGVGDRLTPVPMRDSTSYAPHAPATPVSGQIVSLYGDTASAGQNQVIAINRGARDGLERGHVLALQRDGREVVDTTDPARPMIKLPNERIGTLFVFRVFDRVSYALILTVQDAVKVGDRFNTP